MTILKSFDTFLPTLVLQICILSILISIAGGQGSPCQSLGLTTGCTGMADGYYPLSGTSASYVSCTSGTATVVTCDPSRGGPCYDCAKQACSSKPCTPALPSGAAINCGNPPPSPCPYTIGPKATSASQLTAYMSQAVYTCSSGFWFQQGVFKFVSTCQSTGQWLPKPPPCVLIDCGIPATPLNGWVNYELTAAGNPASAGCNPGYWNQVSLRPTVIWCQNSGQWDAARSCVYGQLCAQCTQIHVSMIIDNIVTCEVYNCTAPPNVPNANYSQSVRNEAIYTCLPGYQFSDGLINHSSQCSNVDFITYAWSSVPSCVPVDCGKPTVTPANAAMVTSTSMSTTYQSNITYQCNLGYWIAKNFFNTTLNCQAYGTWSAASNCTPVSCGSPPVIANGVTPQATLISTYKSIASYTCNTGYSFGAGISSSTITCQANGTWSATPTCTRRIGGPKIKLSRLTKFARVQRWSPT